MGPKIMHQYYFEGSLYCSYGIIPPSPILVIQAPLRVLGFRVLPLGQLRRAYRRGSSPGFSAARGAQRPS